MEKSELPLEQVFFFFIATDVFPIEWLAYQVSMVCKIVQDSSIYILNIIMGCVYDVISHLILNLNTAPELLHIFANGNCVFIL